MPTKTAARPRLGRGLSSLIQVEEPIQASIALPADESQPPAGIGQLDIPLDQVHPNPHQPRRQFNEASLADLAASIKATGLIQPIIVRKAEQGYELIAGERRWRAAKLAGLPDVPALLRDVDSFTQAQMALVENIHREDLNAMDRAAAYRSLIDQLGLTQNELAGRLGEDRSVIANFLRLLDLADPVREYIRAGRLSLGHAKILAGVADILEQQRLAELVVQQDLSVRNLERLLRTGQTPPISRSPSAYLMDLEKSIARQLGMRVQVKPSSKKGKGRLVISYSSLDQFDDLLKRLGVQTDVE